MRSTAWGIFIYADCAGVKGLQPDTQETTQPAAIFYRKETGSMTLYFSTIVLSALLIIFGLWGLKALERAPQRRKVVTDATTQEKAPTGAIQAYRADCEPAAGAKVVEGTCNHV